MQIFTSQGIYDGRMVNKMKQCRYKNAQSYHTSHIDNSELTFIMLQLGSVTIFCMTEKLSHYISGRLGMREKQGEG